VVISGKGGTGKTSVTASLAVLAQRAVLADCDVDAADLHLVLTPRVRERHDFRSGHEAVIRQESCIGCEACLAYCRFGAIQSKKKASEDAVFFIDPVACEGCGVCVRFCPAQAIDFPESLCGEWRVSETRCGPMVHARLGVAAENSGKLVATVRQESRKIAEENGLPLVIVDGPPGIGCPVISSLTGATLVLIVTEPTVSGEHDLERVLALTRHFQIPALICVNEWDLSPDMTERIESKAREGGAGIAGRIRYDRAVTLAQMREMAIVEYQQDGCAEDIRTVYDSVRLFLESRENRDGKNPVPQSSRSV
ncbi:MAG TPA: ATP-binding protein, partial [Candidatus Sumerlaeota bacterium]|nr:ATP-binding protein [Candidatus Sumerlaeota bacterium]